MTGLKWEPQKAVVMTVVKLQMQECGMTEEGILGGKRHRIFEEVEKDSHRIKISGLKGQNH